MAVKVVVLSEEQFEKIQGTVEVLDISTYESLDEYRLASTIEDIHAVIDNMDTEDVTESDKEFLKTNVVKLAEIVLDTFSFSDYNEYITDVLTNALSEKE